MRLKAIPSEAVEFASANPLLLAGVAVIGVVGYVYLHNNQAIVPDADVAASTAQPSYGSYGFAPLSTGGIISTVGSGSTGIVDSGSNTYALQAIQDAKDAKDYDLKKSMFDFEVKKSDQANELAWAQLNANLAIAAVNADIAYQGIQASNYQTSTALAQSFLMSGQSLAMGAVVAPDGSVTRFGFTQYKADTSKKGKATTRYQSVLGSSGFADFLTSVASPQTSTAPALGVAPNATFSGTGSGSASSYALGASTPALQSGGGSIAATVNASSGNNGLGAYKRAQIYGDADYVT